MAKCRIGYRYIPSYLLYTPRMMIPMQRTQIDVDEPCGETQVIDALFRDYGEGFFESRDAIVDVEVERIRGEG